MFNGHGVAKYLLSRAVRAAGIKVVFTGEGADEMLGGYPYYRVDALNGNAELNAGEKSAVLDEMLGANPATRALLMPEQVSTQITDYHIAAFAIESTWDGLADALKDR